MKDKNLAGILALLLGGLGIHKFYLGSRGWGIIYILFFWTWLPTIVSLIEALNFFMMSSDTFKKRYG